MSNIFAGILLNELSTDKLAKYKTAASADATKSDQEGNFKRGDKRFSGIVKATNKQFANDAKKVKLPEAVKDDEDDEDDDYVEPPMSGIDKFRTATGMANLALTPALAAQTVSAGAKALGNTGVATSAGKLAGNLGGRLLPWSGAALSAASAAHRASLGDYTGSAIDAAAGGASFAPGWGTAGSIAGIGTNLLRDRWNTGNWFPTDEQLKAAYGKKPDAQVAQGAKSAAPAQAAAPVAQAAKSATPAQATAPVAKATAPVANTKGSWQEIYNLNKTIIGANPNLIKPGQKLTLPNGTVYTVKPGDSLSKIAAQSVQESIYMQYDKVPSSIMYGLLEASQQSASQFTKVDPASAKIDIPSGRGMSPLEWLASLSNNPAVNGDVEPISTNEVVVIGDSIAVGIGGAGPYAKGGISTAEVLNRVNAFIKTGKAKGSVVILSSGASNSAPVEIEGGATQPGNLAPIEQQLAALKAAGASVALVGTGSKNSVWFPPTKYTNGKRYRIDLTGVNQQLASMASANGAKFLGPLEDYDSGMNSGKGDGVHPFGAYQKLKQAGSAIAPSRIKPAGAASSRIKPEVGADHVDSTVTSNTGDNMSKAKQSAEQFLGRRISNDEWDLLLRAVTAEASGNTKEQAWVMGVILNRVRSGRWGSSINKVLYAPNQFQAVTGTKYNSNPSSNFTRGPNASQLASIVKGAIEVLPNVDPSVMNFTAANSAAYGRGTNINFRNKLAARSGSQQIGQTIFGTA